MVLQTRSTLELEVEEKKRRLCCLTSPASRPVIIDLKLQHEREVQSEEVTSQPAKRTPHEFKVTGQVAYARQSFSEREDTLHPDSPLERKPELPSTSAHDRVSSPSEVNRREF